MPTGSSAESSSSKNRSELKDSYEKEIEIITKRVELLLRLERENLIMYSNGGEVQFTDTANKASKPVQ